MKSFAQYANNSYISLTFPDFSLVFTDGSVSLNSAGFSIYVSKYHIVRTKTLPKFWPSFSTVEHAVIHALHFIKSLLIQKYLIITDSQSLLFSILANACKPSNFYLVICIRSILKRAFSRSPDHNVSMDFWPCSNKRKLNGRFRFKFLTATFTKRNPIFWLYL